MYAASAPASHVRATAWKAPHGSSVPDPGNGAITGHASWVPGGVGHVPAQGGVVQTKLMLGTLWADAATHVTAAAFTRFDVLRRRRPREATLHKRAGSIQLATLITARGARCTQLRPRKWRRLSGKRHGDRLGSLHIGHRRRRLTTLFGESLLTRGRAPADGLPVKLVSGKPEFHMAGFMSLKSSMLRA